MMLGRIRRSLDAGQRRTIALMAAVVIGLHVLGFLLLILVVAHHAGAAVAGTGIAAYTLGLRHAFDADHIAAIDNTTRKLMAEGKRPLSVGFWFSLGHSTVVFALAGVFALGIRGARRGAALAGIAAARDRRSRRHQRVRRVPVRDRRPEPRDPARASSGCCANCAAAATTPHSSSRSLRRAA